MGIRRRELVAAVLLCGAAAACTGPGADSTAPGEAAERMRARAAAVGLWGDHDGWSVVQAPERNPELTEEEEPTALL